MHSMYPGSGALASLVEIQVICSTGTYRVHAHTNKPRHQYAGPVDAKSHAVMNDNFNT